MLAWLNDLLRCAALGSLRCSAGGSCRLLFARVFGCFLRSGRITNAWRGILAMRHSAGSCLALKLSIEHSAREDGHPSVAAEGQWQHPNKSRQYEGAKHAHGNSPFDEAC